MTVLFVGPVVLSVIAVVSIVMGDYALVTKSIVFVIAAMAACLQFVPILQASVHFLVPLFMQLFLCGWWYFAIQFE